MAKEKKSKFRLFGWLKPTAKEPARDLKPTRLAPLTKPTPTVPASPPVTTRLPNQEAGAFTLKFDGSPRADVIVPLGMVATPIKALDEPAIALSGGDPAKAPSTGRTGGLSIRVPDDLEAAASGKRVRVTVHARASSEASTTEFSLAYSTNEVGNSGWRKFTAEDNFEPISFEWDVPPMKDGKGDYVGILPALGQSVEIATLVVEVVPRG